VLHTVEIQMKNETSVPSTQCLNHEMTYQSREGNTGELRNVPHDRR